MEISDCICKYLQELQFADDVLLFATTRKGAVRMLEEVADEAHKVGLQINLGKTKILSNREGQKHEVLKTCGNQVEVLSNMESLNYSGRSVSIG